MEIVNKDTIQKNDSKPIVAHSKFDNSYNLAGTYRYGEYAPTMVADVIPDDNHKINVSHKVKSYTMKQPLFQNIKMHDDTFLVTLDAILPRNAEKFITVPNIGDDINSEEVGTTVVGFPDKVYEFLSRWRSYIISEADFDPDSSEDSHKLGIWLVLSFISMYDTLLSSGSLLNSLGCPLLAESSKADILIDNFLIDFADAFNKPSVSLDVQFGDDGQIINVGKSVPQGSGEFAMSVREFWQRIHDDYNWKVVGLSAIDDFDVFGAFEDYFPVTIPLPVPDKSAPVDIAYCAAYQLACAHFYSNDKVDYVYSAELYRELMGYYLNQIVSDSFGSLNFSNFGFEYNGVSYLYDWLSSFAVSFVFNQFDYSQSDSFLSALSYLRSLFGYNRSLRFVDYFTGSRTLPLAPGDTSVEVKNGEVSVVESIQKKWYIRLWSQISRVGRKRSEQMKGMFPGVDVSVDWHDPIWLKGDEGSVFAEEVDNTGSNQFDESTPIAVTSSLHGGNSTGLSIDVKDRYGIIITISYFDIRRYYSHGIDRRFFHVDRFDKFQPFLQFNGDQKVYQKELNADALFDNVFGYQGHYEEFKSRLDRAFGGFSSDSVLPGMIFLADEGRNVHSIQNIGPDYIRSYPAELDKFFIALSGWSLGTYFHFMMLTENNIDSNRPMAYNPQIQ